MVIDMKRTGAPMQTVIFAGGFGTRISEESLYRPKPMVEIGGRPILWHILKCYSNYGINEFVILAGYKSFYIKDYFINYLNHQSDITVDMRSNAIDIHNNTAEPWKVTILDTGIDTMTGGRLKRALPYLQDQFCLTYGDAVSDIDISELVAFHNSHDGAVTLTSVKPEARFGALSITDGQVTEFREKSSSEESRINGGFFVCDREAVEMIDGDRTIWERAPLEQLAKSNDLFAYQHDGFWAPMDTLREKELLEELWNSGNAPWKKW